MILVLFQVHYYVFKELIDTRLFRRFDISMKTLLTPELLRAARALTGLSQVEVAARAGISQKSLSQMEIGNVSTVYLNDAVRTVFENENIQFIASTDSGGEPDGVGVRRKPKKADSGIRIL